MNKENMLKVANVLENIKPENFHMSGWYSELIEPDMYDLFDIDPEIVDKYYHGRMMQSLSDYHPIEENLDLETMKLSCGTAACIAGWALLVEKSENPNVFDNENFISVSTSAKNYLGLDYDQSHQLFYCEYGSIWDKVADEYDISFDPDDSNTWYFHPKIAADVLRRLAEGNLDFNQDWYDEDQDNYFPCGKTGDISVDNYPNIHK